jgi:hypothetical protein
MGDREEVRDADWQDERRWGAGEVGRGADLAICCERGGGDALGAWW